MPRSALGWFGLLWIALAAVDVAAATSRGITLLGELRPFVEPYSDVWGYADPHGREYALVGVLRGTCVINVSDPAQPYVTATIPGPQSRWRDIKTLGAYAYVVNEKGEGMQIIDLSDPESPALAAQYIGFSTAHNLAIDTTTARAYPCNTDIGEILALSLDDPLHPELLGAYHETVVHDLVVRDGIAYTAEVFAGQFALRSVAPPHDFAVVGGPVTYPNAFTHTTWLTDDGRHLLTADESPGGLLRIWNIEDLEDIRPLGSYRADDEEAFVHNVVVRGRHAYVSHYTAGLRVLDITDPDAPAEVAYFDTFEGPADHPFAGAWGVYPLLPSGHVLVSDIQRGLLVFGGQTAEVPTETTSWSELRARYQRR